MLRDFVDAVQSLRSAEAVECCWSQEPGELHWNLRRIDQDIEIEILKVPDISFPGQHRGNAEPVFKARGRWVTFARQLLSSLESIKTDMGCEGYERAWRNRCLWEEEDETAGKAVQRRSEICWEAISCLPAAIYFGKRKCA